MSRLSLFIALFILPLIGFARSYDASNLPYTDAPTDLPTSIGISVLTEEGILHGHPDGTFRPDDLLNRAEYVKIVMGLVDIDDMAFVLGCFPDVPLGSWYEVPVCKARAFGIVRGNEQEGVPPERWFFEPERPVQYEEAVKVLVEIFTLPTILVEGGEWYEPYIRAAILFGIDLSGLEPGHMLTRGEMARLVAAFIAYDAAELSLLRAAEAGEIVEEPEEPKEPKEPEEPEEPEVTPPPPPPPPPTPPSVTYDPNTDDSTRPQFVLLGEASPVLAAASIQSEAEPLDVTDILVVLQNAVTSIDFFRVYDHDGIFLGNAHLDTSVNNKTYRLPMQSGQLHLPKQDDFSFYVRAVAKDNDSGGVSGETVEVDKLTVEGDGSWSNNAYSQSTSDTFSTFQTSRAVFTNISNASDATDVLTSGPGQPLGKFSFEGKQGDSSADLEIQKLVFRIEQTGSVTLSNVELSTEDTSERMSCTVAASEVTCSSLSTSFGAVNGDVRKLQLFGDISIPSGASNASLRLTLNEAGSVSSAGSITWTDGTTTFSWVPFESPVARGTYFSF